WSRRVNAAETRESCPSSESVRPLASMEPPRERGGNSIAATFPRPESPKLQWSRRVNAAETRSRASSSLASLSASMEPPRERGGNAFGHLAPWVLPVASMEPPRERGGNRHQHAI